MNALTADTARSEEPIVRRGKRTRAHLSYLPRAVTDDMLFGPEGIREGFHTFALTNGLLSVTDVLCHVVDTFAPCDVSIMTWVISGVDAEKALARIADGRISRFRMVMDRMQEQGNARKWARSSWLLGRFGAEALRVTKTHAKCVAVRGSGYDVAIQSSGNMNANFRCEQIDIADDPVIAEAIRYLVGRIFETHPPGMEFGLRGMHALKGVLSGAQLDEYVQTLGSDGTPGPKSKSGPSNPDEEEADDWGTMAAWPDELPEVE